jgi:DNA-binding MarR family transcriptional regulator
MGGPRGWHGGPHPDHFEHGEGHRHGGGPGMPGMPPWASDPSGRFGGPARMRMLEALAAASTPLSVSDLGAAIGVDQPRASRLVQQGVAHGFVRREADPDDARRTRIALTDEGRAVARGMRGERREALGKALAAFTVDEREQLAMLLNKLADNWEN